MVCIFDITSNNCAARTRLNSVTVRVICPPSFDNGLTNMAQTLIDNTPIDTILQIATDIMASAFWYDNARLQNSTLYEEIRRRSQNRISIGNVSWTQNTTADRQLLVTIELFQILRVR